MRAITTCLFLCISLFPASAVLAQGAAPSRPPAVSQRETDPTVLLLNMMRDQITELGGILTRMEQMNGPLSLAVAARDTEAVQAISDRHWAIYAQKLKPGLILAKEMQHDFGTQLKLFGVQIVSNEKALDLLLQVTKDTQEVLDRSETHFSTFSALVEAGLADKTTR